MPAVNNIPFTSKEISWLSFNTRVLQEARDPKVPLIERLKFLGIFSSNLDEFFRIRFSTLKKLVNIGKNAMELIGHDPSVTIKQIQKIVMEQTKIFEETYRSILAGLAEEKIFIINEKQLDPEQSAQTLEYFRNNVRPNLAPIMLKNVKTLPAFRDDLIYFSVSLVRSDKPDTPDYCFLEVPAGIIPRFYLLPKTSENQYIILLDDIIRCGLQGIFSVFGYDHFEAYTIKLTKDAELDIDDDYSESYIKKIARCLRSRKKGMVVRFVYDSSMPENQLLFFLKLLRLDAKNDAVIPGGRYHNFRDFINFPKIGPARFFYKPQPPLPHPDIKPGKLFFDLLKEKDILLNFPYHSFSNFIDLLREAAIDPAVHTIKITIYRAAKNSSVINALINAVKNGKNVIVVVELQARFDEEANIFWANRLREEGARVIFGVPGLKVHSKLCLIIRREKKERYYAAVGTGNFNEQTSKIYTDTILFTSDQRISMEVASVFDFFEHNYKVKKYRHLLIAPYKMRKRLISLIDFESSEARSGRPAKIMIKINNIEDREIIASLYEAHNSGVEICMMVRGMFSMRIGVPGFSERMEAYSLVDRYLEHSRLLVFHNAGSPRFFLGSADFMPRNFDRRVEIFCPIYDPALQQDIIHYLNLQFRDDTKSRILDHELANQYKSGGKGTFNAQRELYLYFRNKLKER